MLTVDNITNRIRIAKANKELWRERLRECYEYAYPEQNTWDNPSAGQNQRKRLHDDTAVNSLSRYASKMVQTLIPQTKYWIVLEAGSNIEEGAQEEVNQLLENVTNVLFDNINASNLTSQATESFHDVGISTGALIQELGDGLESWLNYRAVPMQELILEKSSLGRVDNVFREFKVSAGDVNRIFPQVDFPESLIDLSRKDPGKEVKITEGEVSEVKEVKDLEGRTVRKLIYTRFVMYAGSFVYQQEFDYPSWIIFRETTMAGEVYGRGRVMRSINDIKAVNLLAENTKRASDYLAPMFTMQDDSMFNAPLTNLMPGSIIPVESNDNSAPTLRQLAVNPNIGQMVELIRYYQGIINSSLLNGVFGDIQETPVRTATEMAMRDRENQAQTASSTGNFLVEFIRPIVMGAVKILQGVGQLPPIEVNGKDIKVRYMSPASRAQDEGDIVNLMQSIELIAQLPSEKAINKIKWEEIPDEIFDKKGVPLRLLKTEDELLKEQQQQAMAQQQAQQQAMQMQGEQIAMQEQAKAQGQIEVKNNERP